jgi:hypothetical protein
MHRLHKNVDISILRVLWASPFSNSESNVSWSELKKRKFQDSKHTKWVKERTGNKEINQREKKTCETRRGKKERKEKHQHHRLFENLKKTVSGKKMKSLQIFF